MSPLFKEYNSSPERILQKIKEYLENRQYQAYQNISGLCNPILSKNPFTSNFIKNYLQNAKISFPVVLLIKSFLYFLAHNTYTLFFEALKILIIKKNLSQDPKGKPILISFFNYHKLNDSLFDELYLPSLQRELIENKIPYIYFPKLHLFPKNPFKTVKAISSIKARNSAFISIYEVIPRRRVFQLIYLSFSYYYHSMKTLKPFSSHTIDQAYNYALIESLKYSEAFKLLHYIATKELLKKKSSAQIVLWYENQTIDKCIIKAIRESGSSISILGCQFFLMTPQEQNLFPSKYEIENNLIPDKIFIMQETPQNTTLINKYFLGKGLRYLYLQKYDIATIPNGQPEVFTIFLTIFRDVNKQTLNILSKANLNCRKLLIKKHPVLLNDPIVQIRNAEVVTTMQEELLLQSEIIFATDTGLIYEAMAMNRQVIIIGSENSINHFIPPYEYHDKLWIRVTNSQELMDAIYKLRDFKNTYPEKLKLMSQKVKNTYFKNSDEPILKLLGIIGND